MSLNNNIKNIVVSFYKTKDNDNATFADKIIAWWTNGEYSHVELVIDGYMYSTSPRDSELEKRNISKVEDGTM